MRAIALILALVVTVTLTITLSASAATLVSIDPANLPTSNQASYAHAWAVAQDQNNAPDICDDGSGQNKGKTDGNGGLVECHQKFPPNTIPWPPAAGDYAQADSSAQVTGGVGNLSATVNAYKSSPAGFAAAAAYAKGGGTVRKAGSLNGGTLTSLVYGGLKLTGQAGGTRDYKIRLMVSKAPPKQLNKTLLSTILTQEAIQALQLPTGWTIADVPESDRYLDLEIEFRGDAQNPKIVRAKAQRLCPASFGPHDDPELCKPKAMFLTEKDFVDPCPKKGKPKDCDKTKYRETKSAIVFTLWIPVATTQDISIDEVHCTKKRKNEKDPTEEICLAIPTKMKEKGS